MASLRILRVSERIPPERGGKEIHVAELTQAQMQIGHDLHLMYRFGRGERLDVPSTRVSLGAPLRRLGGALGTTCFGFTCAHKALSGERPDIVHVHGDFTEALPLSSYAHRVNAKLILTVHGGLNPRYNRISRHAMKGVSHFIALGERVVADLNQVGIPASKITTMSSGLNTELLGEARRDGPVREPGLIVMTGSLDPVKNIPFVIKTVLALPESEGAHLEIIGEGNQRSELESIIGSSPRVTLRGQLTRAEVYRRLVAADVFVMASRRLSTKAEGVPTALLEAMGLGKMCLVSTEALPTPVVGDTSSYLTFVPTDSHALATRVSWAIASRHEREPYELKAATAVSHLGWPQVAALVGDVYERALHRRN